ncbi:MAG: formate dehydrogenase accessory sulfurtransferase FdhD, partial [Armatimonadota bacterium]
MGVERPVVRWNHESGPKPSQMDAVAEEAPLAVHLDGVAIATVLRTPGNDTELAIGFCIAEGLLVPGESLAECTESHGQVRLRSRRPGRTPRPTEARRFPANSACGACGRPPGSPLAAEGRYAHAKHFTALCPEALVRLPDRLRTEQPDFAATGGIHAAGLWDPDDDTLRVREDVGRHNAVDKIVGRALLAGDLPQHGTVLQVSGRVSF